MDYNTDIRQDNKSCNTNIGRGKKSCTSDVGGTLNFLRQELTLLQEQDVLLLKQLMNVHYSIRMLKRKLSRRTSSFTTLSPSLIRTNIKVNGMTRLDSSGSKFSSSTLQTRSTLSRVMSEPSKNLMYERSLSVTTEEEDGEDEEEELAYYSTDSDATDPLMASLNIDPEMSALLTDMPKSLRCKYLKSLNHNSYVLSRVPTNESIKVTSTDVLHNDIVKSSFKTKQSSSTYSSKIDLDPDKTLTRRSTNKLCRSDAIHEDTVVSNRLCSGELNGDVTYDSDSSSGGIEITAL